MCRYLIDTSPLHLMFMFSVLVTASGLAHGTTGQCLRQANPDNTFTTFSSYNVSMPNGFGLEDVLVKGGVDAYFCAHEHVFQVEIILVSFLLLCVIYGSKGTSIANDVYNVLQPLYLQAHTAEGVHHFMCGASGSEMRRGSGLYEGAHEKMSLDWVCKKTYVMLIVLCALLETMHN